MPEIIRLLEQAVAYDPTFLLAYCEPARAHAYVYHLGVDHAPARVALAEEAATRLCVSAPIVLNRIWLQHGSPISVTATTNSSR